jgi:hypothetical protein
LSATRSAGKQFLSLTQQPGERFSSLYLVSSVAEDSICISGLEH